MNDLPDVVQSGLVWLRPQWLWMAVPVVAAALLWWYRETRITSVWNATVDPHLRPYVLEGDGVVSRRSGIVLILAWFIVVIVLAGPVFEQESRPLSQASRAEVLIVDLSRSMAADDLSPDRISRARFKLADILDRVGDDRLGLLAFAERPYVISPLTDDMQTLRAFLPSLSPELMPAQGSRMDLAIEKGLELLEGAGVRQGHLLLITDGLPGDAERDTAALVRTRGHRLSVLAVGTPVGAPLRDASGGFVNDANGQIVIPRLELNALQSLADAGGGVMTSITSDATDIESLERARSQAFVQGSASEDLSSGEFESTSRQWIERGPWVVPLIALLSLYLFRRGVVS